MGSKQAFDGWGQVVAYRWAELTDFYIKGKGGKMTADHRLVDLARNWWVTERSMAWPSPMDGGFGRSDPRFLRSVVHSYFDARSVLVNQPREINQLAAYIVAGAHLLGEEKTVYVPSPVNPTAYIPTTVIVGRPTLDGFMDSFFRGRPPVVRRRAQGRCAAFLRDIGFTDAF